jgi:hypothetical protein
MDGMKLALEKAGFDEYAKQRTHDAKNHWLLKNGLRTILPIKQVRLHLGARRTEGGVWLLDECFVTRVREMERERERERES